MSTKILSTTLAILFMALAFSPLLAVTTPAGGTELTGPGFALIAAPIFGFNDHLQEAEDLRDYLLDNGWTDEQIIFLTDSTESYVDGDATKENIEDALDDIALLSGPGDLVFVAILDHAVEGEDGHTYFRTGDIGDPVYIKDSELDDWLDDIEDFSTMIVEISSPYSGGFVQELKGQNRIIIADCGASQTYTSCEYSFAQALVEPLADEAQNGQISVEEAYEYMEDTMVIQDPVIYDHQKDTTYL